MLRLRIGTTIITAVAATVTLGMRTAAQTCQGAASFATGPMRAGAGLTIANQAKTYGADFGLGSAVGAYGDVSLGRTEYDNLQNGSAVLGISGGYTMDVNPARSAQFCPIAAFEYQNGPSIPTGFGNNVDVTAHALSFGGAFGGVATSTPTFAFVPYGAASFVAARGTGTLAGSSQSTSQNYELTEIGAGFVMNRTLTIRPSVAFPVGLAGGKSTFQLAVGFNFGGASAVPAKRR